MSSRLLFEPDFKPALSELTLSNSEWKSLKKLDQMCSKKLDASLFVEAVKDVEESVGHQQVAVEAHRARLTKLEQEVSGLSRQEEEARRTVDRAHVGVSRQSVVDQLKL